MDEVVHSWQGLFQSIEEVSVQLAIQQMEQWNVFDAVMLALLPPGAATTAMSCSFSSGRSSNRSQGREGKT